MSNLSLFVYDNMFKGKSNLNGDLFFWYMEPFYLRHWKIGSQFLAINFYSAAIPTKDSFSTINKQRYVIRRYSCRSKKLFRATKKS